MRLVSGELDVAISLFLHGMVWDGNVASKDDRDRLVAAGYAVRHEGMQALTGAGTVALLLTPAFWRWAFRRTRCLNQNPFVATREQNRKAMCK
jgi:hypothetical protein